MIKRKYLGILDVLSVLLFSLLANFIFDLKIDFLASWNINTVLKLLFLSLSTFIFFFAIDRIKQIALDARDEFMAEQDDKKKYAKGIDSRYYDHYQNQKIIINLLLYFSLFFFFCYFFLDAIIGIFKL